MSYGIEDSVTGFSIPHKLFAMEKEDLFAVFA